MNREAKPPRTVPRTASCKVSMNAESDLSEKICVRSGLSKPSVTRFLRPKFEKISVSENSTVIIVITVRAKAKAIEKSIEPGMPGFLGSFTSVELIF